MSVEQSDIEKIATLSRIRIDQNDVPEVAARINDILAMVDIMAAIITITDRAIAIVTDMCTIAAVVTRQSLV